MVTAPSAAPTAAESKAALPDATRWVTAVVLTALATAGLRRGDAFTPTNLRQWVPGIKPAQIKQISETLRAHGFITSRMVVSGAATHAVFTVTAAGAEAIKGAALGAGIKSGPKGPHTADRAVGQGTFAARLWRLMRARQMLDTGTAAETLVDAGSDNTAVERAAKTAQRYLARWASTGAVKESAQRLANGRKRYVLITDTPHPPAWTPGARARAAQHKGSKA